MYNVFNKNATPHQDIYINIFTIYRIIVMMNEEKRRVQLTGGSTQEGRGAWRERGEIAGEGGRREEKKEV